MGWLIKKNSIAVICLFLSLFLSCTQTPTNPFSKDKTTAALVVHSSPTLKALGGHLFTDTLGAVTQLGIASNLMTNLDTVQITIVSVGAGIDTDVIITNFTNIKDTVWVSYTCRDTGTKFIYTKACVQDWNTLKDTAFLTVYARTNHPPRISVSGQLTISAGTLCSLSVVASDPDAGQTLLYSIGNKPSSAQFDTISKIFRWTPGITDTGTDTILFKVVDNGFPPMADFQKVAVTVSSSKVNHAPKWQINTINENAIIGTAINLTLSSMCSDPDGDSLSFILLNGTPARDTIINGIYSWTPLAQDTGSYSVHIVAQAPQGLNDTLLIHLTASTSISTNHRPVLTVSGARNIKTGTTCALTPSATDADASQTLTYSLLKQPAGSSFSAGVFTWTPAATFKGVDTAIFIVIDNGVPPMSDTALVQITVSDSIINRPPKWALDTVNLVTTVGTALNLTLSDKCADPDGDSLSFMLLTGTPVGDTIKNSVFSFTPAIADTGVYWPQIIASDPKGLRDTLQVRLTVTAGDRKAPYLKLFSPATDSATVGTSSTTVKIVCKDSSGMASVKCSMGTDTFAVSHTDSTYTASVFGLKTTGINEILFIATDASANANRDTLKVHVKYDPTIRDNVPPAIHFVNPSNDTVIGADSFVVQAVCYDPSRIFSLVGLRDSTAFTLTRSATIDSFWTGTAKDIKAGQYSTVKLIATDSSTARNKDTVSVRIKYDNDMTAPTVTLITPSKDSATTNSSSYTVTLQCTDASGVLSVNGLMGTSTFTGTRGSGSNWTVTINGLTSNAFNTIIFTATDSSLRANRTMDTLHIKYDPTMLDTIGPTIQLLSGPHSGDIVSSSSVTIVDTVYDPSSIDSVYWTLNKGAINTVTGSSGKYSISVALSRENLDTIVVTTVDNATRHNHSTQMIILNFIKAPAITTQPASQAVCSGSQAIFTVAATGTPPLSYQWRTGATNPANISGATTPLCTLKNATTTTILSCVVSNQGAASATSNLCTLTVNVPPTISNPSATSICVGNSGATMIVTSSSGATLQWIKGSPIGTHVTLTPSTNYSGVTSATLTFNSAAASIQDSFYCVATSSGCSTTSATAYLTVNAYPVISTQPGSQNICVGGSVTLNISASGSSYQWQKGGINISGANSSSYLINSIATGDAANYSCVVSNGSCSVTSQTATLTMTNYQLLTTAGNGGSITMPSSSPTIIPCGAQITIIATPFTGYHFASWEFTSGTGTIADMHSATTTIKLNSGNATIRANFEVRDTDGNVYATYNIGGQTWLQSNLRTTRYNDGSPIPKVTDATQWANLAGTLGYSTGQGFCWFNNDSATYASTGALYNWNVINTGNLTPVGWHVATQTDWVTLTNALGTTGSAANYTSPSGFAAVPGGARSGYDGSFFDGTLGPIFYWWTASNSNSSPGQSYYYYFQSSDLNHNTTPNGDGYCVRCVRDY